MSGFSFFNKVKIFTGCLFFGGLFFGNICCVADNIEQLKTLNQNARSIFYYDYKTVKALLEKIGRDSRKALEYLEDKYCNRHVALSYIAKNYKLLYYFLKKEFLAENPVTEISYPLFFPKVQEFNNEQLNRMETKLITQNGDEEESESGGGTGKITPEEKVMGDKSRNMRITIIIPQEREMEGIYRKNMNKCEMKTFTGVCLLAAKLASLPKN